MRTEVSKSEPSLLKIGTAISQERLPARSSLKLFTKEASLSRESVDENSSEGALTDKSLPKRANKDVLPTPKVPDRRIVPPLIALSAIVLRASSCGESGLNFSLRKRLSGAVIALYISNSVL